MESSLLLDLQSRDLPRTIGNKAQGLRRLMEIKARVPRAWVVPWEAYERYCAGDTGLREELAGALASALADDRSYAVRSSSNAEDTPNASYAGLFSTALDVRGAPAIAAAICDVWGARNSPAVEAYVARRGLDGEALRLAVLVQEMVTPVHSGVLFSRNPMTGTHEIVIEAVQGEGTALVQEGRTPERWVHRAGSWVARPETGMIPDSVARDVLTSAQPLLRRAEKPVDLEWVHDGHAIYWVQMRDITALTDVKVYSNRISRDMMPGQIHPLIWSINVPLINAQWIHLLEEIVGSLGLSPEDLARSFYYRSYFDMGSIGRVFASVGLPSEGLEMMMGLVPRQEGRPASMPGLASLRHLPRLVAFALNKWRFERVLEAALPWLRDELDTFSVRPDPGASPEALVAEFERLRGLMDQVVYCNIVTPLLVPMVLRILERQLRALDMRPLDYDLTAGMAELAEYNPNMGLERLHVLYEGLDVDARQALGKQSGAMPKDGASDAHGTEDTVAEDARLGAFQAALSQFVERFGHLSDNSNNFMAVPWREQPDLVLSLVRDYAPPAVDRRPPLDVPGLRTNALRRRVIASLHGKYRRLSLWRERVSATYIHAYGLFRPYTSALAQCFVDRGWLDSTEQIYCLTWNEIRAAVGASDGSHLRELACERMAEMARCADVDLPEVIYGDVPPPLLPGHHERLYGTPTSQGYATGRAVLVRGLADFGRVQPGDVLIVPYSDVGWTPLFARAGAVIAESGGMLSHSSIIAREYGIPAVVSVSAANTIEDGQHVSVNGYTGEIVLIGESVPDQAQREIA